MNIGCEHGFTRMANQWLDFFLPFSSCNLSHSETVVFLTVVRMTYGFGRKSHAMSGADLGKRSGLNWRTANKALRGLVDRGMVVCYTPPVGPRPGVYGPNKDYSGWASTLSSDNRVRRSTLSGDNRVTLSSDNSLDCPVTAVFSSGDPTLTSDCRTPKENSKETLLKNPPHNPPRGEEAVVEISCSIQEKVCSGVLRRIASTFGRVSDKYRQRVWAASAPVMSDVDRWASQFRDRFHHQLAQVENSWKADSASIKSPIALLVSRLEAEAMQLRKELEGR